MTPNHFRDDFLSSGAQQLTGLNLAFGVTDVDRSKFDKWDPYNTRGDPIYFDEFEMYDVGAVKTVLRLCDELD